MVDIRGWERQKGHSAFGLASFLYWPLYLGLFMDSYVSPIAAKPFFLGESSRKDSRRPFRDRISAFIYCTKDAETQIDGREGVIAIFPE